MPVLCRLPIIELHDRLFREALSPFDDLETRAMLFADAVKVADEVSHMAAQLQGWCDPEL